MQTSAKCPQSWAPRKGWVKPSICPESLYSGDTLVNQHLCRCAEGDLALPGQQEKVAPQPWQGKVAVLPARPQRHGSGQRPSGPELAFWMLLRTALKCCRTRHLPQGRSKSKNNWNIKAEKQLQQLKRKIKSSIFFLSQWFSILFQTQETSFPKEINRYTQRHT